MKQYPRFYQENWPIEHVLYQFEYIDYTINFEKGCKMVPLVFVKNAFPVKQNTSVVMWKRFNMMSFNCQCRMESKGIAKRDFDETSRNYFPLLKRMVIQFPDP